jgi:hypothetical protein
MVSDFLAALQQAWAVPVIGLTVAGLAFLAGRQFFRRRAAPRPAAPSLPGEPPPSPLLAAPTVKGEQRIANRRVGHAVGIELTDPEGKEAPQQGWVEDRSLGGLSLLTPRPAAVGAVGSVRPCNAPRATPLVAVEVLTCVAQGSEWRLGCRYVKTPSYAVLLQFG